MQYRSGARVIYTLERASQVCGLDGRTIERIILRGLIVPGYEDEQPVFTEEHIAELRRIRRMHQLGVNLAGVEVILQMRQRIVELEAEVERLNAEIAGRTRHAA